MQNENRLVPQLRFSEFEGVWEEKKLGEVSQNIGYGMNASAKSFDGVNQYIRITDIDEASRKFRPNPLSSPEGEIEGNFLLNEGDILFTRTGASVGKSYMYDKQDGKLLFAGFLIRFNIVKANPNFIFLQTFLEKYNKWVHVYSMRSGQPGLNAEEYKSLKILLPQPKEQQKIANFLTTIDIRIQILEKRKSFLEQYKKGVMQKIFKQELRFKDENGNAFRRWEKTQLSAIAERVKTKNKIDNQNVLTISAQLGLVSQLEYFNKSVSAKNLTGYYLIEKNDFAYNKSYSKGYPMGAIKRLDKYDLGVVSTLYICFRFNEKVSLDFMEQYFDAGLQNREIEKVAQEGARNHGLLNIGVNDFFEIDLTIPSLEEQTKIANFLSAIDKNIALVNTKIEQTKTYKKGLLQQMFV